MNRNISLIILSIPLGLFLLPVAFFFYKLSGKSLMYVNGRIYQFLITLRHGKWYEERLDKAIEYLDLSPGVRVLEVGCGAGKFSKRLLGRGVKLKGIDINENFICELQRRYEGSFEMGDALNLKYPGNTFDRAVMFDIMHHLGDYEKAVRELVRVLRPGGYAIIWEGSETFGEDKIPPKFSKTLMEVLDGKTNAVDIDALKRGFDFKEIEPYCYRLTK
ncbi:MAG: methyltransferase domain-containing protein [Candidatus Altiarchaeota archaeon]|nr:methyltransferase domain-containing protein [Candidatus Altiarchaeota archaeon]